jgi:hypothetical protein
LALVRHDATKEASLAVPESWGSLGRTSMLRRSAEMGLHLRASAHLKFMSQHADFSLVVLLHLELILFELIDFVTDKLHLLNLLGDLAFDLLRVAALIVEFRPKRIHNFV